MKALPSLPAYRSSVCLDAGALAPRVSRCLRELALGAGLLAATLGSAWASGPESILPPQFATSSTVPANGDVTPYGIAFVPAGVPSWSTLKPGDVVVSNFNAQLNLQGTGTTIVKIVPTTAANCR